MPRPVLHGLILAAALLAGPAHALDLAMPAPVAGLESRSEDLARYGMPTGRFADGAVPQRVVEGALDQRAYRLEGPGLSLTELASPLRAALEAQGFTILFDCETRDCGGFDFRFAIEVMPEPGMHVDLGDFRFIAAERPGEVVTLLVSRSPGFGFVQVTRVGAAPLPAEAAPVAPDPVVPILPPEEPTAPVSPADPADSSDVGAGLPPEGIVARLLADGHVALDDLVFASGAAVLEEGDFASLAALADWLAGDPARSIVLVGHTDASGGLKANIDLSKKRAEGVRQVLLMRYGVAPGQVSAQGAGPLAPRAPNLTAEGQQKNRRVEAVLASTQ